MSKRALSLLILTAIILSACGGQGTQVVDTATVPPATTAPPPTQTEAQVEVPTTGETQEEMSTPEATSTATIIPTPFVPENAADCTNLASFVSDVTIPDNTPVTAGEAFTKTWRVQNKGTCIWWSGYTLEYYSENAMSAPASVPLPVTNPGETADISIDLVAPSVAGTFRGNFVIKNPNDLIMQVDDDSRLWVIVNVGAAPAGATTAVSGDSTSGSGTAVATTSGGGATTASNANCAYTVDTTRTAQVATAINNYRAQSSIVAYNIDPLLSQAAQNHAADMACNKLTYHNGSDGSTPKNRVDATGYVASRVAENVQFNYPPYSPEQAVTWWKLDQTDPNHNRNLISTQYTEIGVGYAFFDNFGYYVVVFATP